MPYTSLPVVTHPPMSRSEGSGFRVGVDVGGTFTDLVILANDEVMTAKVPSTPQDQSVGVIECFQAAGVDPTDVASIAHGTTVATNTLLERRGARTAIVTTEGFRDVLEIGRQNRPSLYDLAQDRPAPLVPRDLRFSVRERTTPEGVVRQLDPRTLGSVIASLRHADVDAVAICLLFSFLHPAHEREIAERLRSELPGVRLSVSSDVLPEFREFERFSTTVADAYLGPGLSAYFRTLEERVQQAGMPIPVVMQSSGGVIEMQVAASRAAACVLSGPAGGVIGAAQAAAASGLMNVLTFDMGGTSTDVAPVIDGKVEITTDSVVAGVPIKFPMVDVHTVSAGGGSIAWMDEGGALRIGPESAGADPGPMSYGGGGARPTITDANLFLGYLEDGAVLGGQVRLRRKLAERGLHELGSRMKLDVLQVARGIVQVANADMTRALRVISVERGLDPREFALVAFGGAGPLHACALAEELGIKKVAVPKSSGVLSAYGLAISDLRRDYVQSFLAPLEEAGERGIGPAYEKLIGQATDALRGAVCQRFADLRYRGQSFELTVPAPDLDGLADQFHGLHQQRYGYRMDGEPIEVVNLRVVATVPGEVPSLREGPPKRTPMVKRRRAYFESEWIDTEVFAREQMGAGSQVVGPSIVEFAEATCVIPPGWSGAVDEAGSLILERDS